MKVLLTGASSFTGTWFAEQLIANGHQVTAALRGSVESYSGLRARRVSRLRTSEVRLVSECTFGSPGFISLLSEGYDVVCNHAANVENYKSPDFDVLAALRDNTFGLRDVLQKIKASGVRALIQTGSVFEQDEGVGTPPLRAVSPYGLSKGLTWQVFRHWALDTDLPLHKFVIPNPFGPFEEPRFCAYLMQKWSAKQTAVVNTPAYVRDNIHVSLLARGYAAFVAQSLEGSTWTRCSPSGYVESQGVFATRFAQEIGSRLAIEPLLTLGHQVEFIEPFTRINCDRLDTAALGWNEQVAWDQLAEYYGNMYFQSLKR